MRGSTSLRGFSNLFYSSSSLSSSKFAAAYICFVNTGLVDRLARPPAMMFDWSTSSPDKSSMTSEFSESESSCFSSSSSSSSCLSFASFASVHLRRPCSRLPPDKFYTHRERAKEFVSTSAREYRRGAALFSRRALLNPPQSAQRKRERHELNSKIIIPQHTQSALLRTTTTTTTTTRQRRRRTRTINKHKYLGIGGFLLLLLLWEEDFLLVLGIAL